MTGENYLAKELEYMFKYTLATNENGYVEKININKLEERYGSSTKLDFIKSIISENESRSWKGFMKCMKGELLSYLGVDLLNKLINKKFKNYLKKKAWQAVAKAFVANLKNMVQKNWLKNWLRNLFLADGQHKSFGVFQCVV